MRKTHLSSLACLLALSNVAAAQWGGAGRMRVDPWMPNPHTTQASILYSWDDGVSENCIGTVPNGGDLVWFTQYCTTDRGLAADTITAVSVAIGSPLCPQAQTILPGDELRIFVWDDVDDNNDPNDGLECRLEDTVGVADPYTDIKTTYVLSEPIQVEGEFYVGAGYVHTTNEFPNAFDQSEPGTSSSGKRRTWWAGAGPGIKVDCDLSNATFFEEADAIGLQGLNMVEATSTGTGVLLYCTAKSGLICGVPAMAFEGIAEAGASSGFTLSAAPARGNRSGFLLYGTVGPAAFPFQGGTLCVNPAPLRRTVAVNSGGTNGACDGVFALDFNAFASGNAGGNPDPALGMSGTVVNAQWWGRDSVATGSFLSDGAEFTMM